MEQPQDYDNFNLGNQSLPYRNPMQQFGGNIDKLTNPDNELRKLEMAFRNYSLNYEKKYIKVGEPLMNELGISSVVGQTQAIVSRITIMSNLNEKEIPILLDFLGDTLAKDLMMNNKIYNITAPAARDKIYFQSLAVAFTCMKRSFNEGERKFWGKIQQEIISKIEGQQKKDGWLSGLIGWGKNG